MRTRVAQGREPDYYALTRQNPIETSRRVVSSTRVEDVHIAWKIIGHRHRRVYELIVHRRLNDPPDVFAAAHTATSTGYATLGALATAGLITRGRGHVSPGPMTLDDIAAAHRLDEQRAQRIQRHQRERANWHNWLTNREEARNLGGVDHDGTGTAVAGTHAAHHQEEYLAAVLATGPPTIDEEHHAIELLSELIGARVIVGV